METRVVRTGERIAGGSDVVETKVVRTGERIAGGSDEEDACTGA